MRFSVPFSAFSRWAFRRIIAVLHFFGPRLRSTPPQLILFKTDGIGDLVLASACIHHLAAWARQEKGWPTKLIVAGHSRDFAQKEFPECAVVAVPFSTDGFRGGAFTAIREARREFKNLAVGTLVSLRHQPTLVQDLFLSWLSAGDSYAVVDCAIQTSPAHARKFRAKHAVSYPAPSSDYPGEIVAHAALASMVTETVVSPARMVPRLRAFPVSDSNTLVLFPFASDDVRQYPIEKLASVIRSLAEGFTFSEILLCGPPSLRPRLEAFQSLLGSFRLSGVVKTTPTILNAIPFIAAAKLVVGMDSGPAHIAIALEKTGVFVLGGGHYGFFAPWGNPFKQQWISHFLPCYHCNWHCKFSEPKCITDIPPEKISSAALSLLGGSIRRNAQNLEP